MRWLALLHLISAVFLSGRPSRLPDREANVRGAFLAAAGVSGRRVVIIDDVTTTGSTLAELAAALIAGGAVEVDAWCVARADRREIQTPATGERSP